MSKLSLSLAALAAVLTLSACEGIYRGMPGDGRDFTITCIDGSGYPSKRASTDAVCHRAPIVAAN